MTPADFPPRRPSIGDDGDAVLAHVDGLLPDWTEFDTLAALQAYGYAAGTVLTPDGIRLADRWAVIRAETARERRAYGLLTEPSPDEIRDNARPDGPSLLWPRQRPPEGR